MRYIARSSLPVPSFFRSEELTSLRRHLPGLFGSGTVKRSQSFVERSRGYLEERLSGELAEIFRRTCVYCERQGDGAPYRFRPETEAEPVEDRSTSHLYYAWLATSWDNWLWVCAECRPGNEAHFPVRGARARLPDGYMLAEFSVPTGESQQIDDPYASDQINSWLELPPSWSDLGSEDSRIAERNVLLDPCTDEELWRHLTVTPDWHLVGLTERGTATIARFKLERPKLLEERRDILGQFDHRYVDKLLPLNRAPETMPFSGLVALRLRFLVSHIALRSGRLVKLGWDDLMHSFRRLHSLPDWDSLFEEARNADPLASAVKVVSQRHRPAAAAAALPRLTRLEIENFKSLERLSFSVPEHARQGSSREETSAAGSLLILGENATGKSTILEGAVLCLVGPSVRDALKLDPHRLVLDPRFMDPGLRGGPKSARLAATFADGRTRELIVTDGEYRSHGEPSDQPVFAYGAFRQYLKKSRKRLPADHQVSTLFATDRLLPNPTAWLLSLDPDRFNMVARSLRSIFAVEGDFDVIQREGEVCYVVSRYEHGAKRRQERTPLDIVSSGFRAILAMACDIMRGLMEGRNKRHFQSLINARAIVFIDEIEAHLHPRWKIAIMASLREALPNVTFIATSHDPLCLRGMASGEVMVMNRVRGEKAPGSKWPIFIESMATLPNIEELTIEQLLTADFFQLNSTSSRETDREYARIADLLRRQRGAATGTDPGLKPEEKEALRSFTEEINRALPVGDTEVQRLVQDAVAAYLRERATQTQEGLKKLRAKTRGRILEALRSI